MASTAFNRPTAPQKLIAKERTRPRRYLAAMALDARNEPEHVLRVQQMFIEQQPALRSYVLSIVRDFALTQDVVQDVFLAITAKAGEFELGTSFLAWARAVARLEALAALRRANRPSLSDEVLELLAASDAAQRPPPRAEWLERCLGKLSPTVQRIMKLRYEEALTPAEIARLVGWTANSVCVATARARRDIRDCIERHMQQEAR